MDFMNDSLLYRTVRSPFKGDDFSVLTSGGSSAKTAVSFPASKALSSAFALSFGGSNLSFKGLLVAVFFRFVFTAFSQNGPSQTVGSDSPFFHIRFLIRQDFGLSRTGSDPEI